MNERPFEVVPRQDTGNSRVLEASGSGGEAIDHVFGRRREEAAYEKTWAAVRRDGRVMEFRSIGPLVGLKEKEAWVVKVVMTHVVSWLGERVVGMRNSRGAERPCLRAAVKERMMGMGRRSGMETRMAEDWAESRAIRVERVVMEGVWAHRKGRREEEAERLLATYPEDDYERNGARFRQEGLWKTILVEVEEMVGGQFAAPWDRGAEREAGAEERFTEGLAQPMWTMEMGWSGPLP